MNRMVQRARDEESGFTLIELMIVIVILGVLAGIVIFAVGGITDNGNVAACKSDVKTVSVAVEAYKAKNGSFPPDLEPTLTPTRTSSCVRRPVSPLTRSRTRPAATPSRTPRERVQRRRRLLLTAGRSQGGSGGRLAGPPTSSRDGSDDGQAELASTGSTPGGLATSLGDRLLATASS